MTADVTVRGDIQRLHLEPGDKLVFTADAGTHMSSDTAQRLAAQLKEQFPNTEILVVWDGMLSVVSE